MSLIGMYSTHLMVNDFPARLARINLLVIFEDVKEPFENLFVTVITPKAEPIKLSHPVPSDMMDMDNINVIIELSPFKIQGAGKAKFEIRFAEDEEKPSIVHNFSIKARKSA